MRAATELARIDALHCESPTCWVAIAECAHDDSAGHRFLVAVAEWMPVPNVAGRYLVERTSVPGQVQITFRPRPDDRLVIRAHLRVDGAEFWERGIHSRAFRSQRDAAEWLGTAVA